MGEPIGWIPPLPKGMTMPPRYGLHAEAGMGERVVYYYWAIGDGGNKDFEFSDSVRDKRKAVRMAWAHFKARSA